MAGGGDGGILRLQPNDLKLLSNHIAAERAPTILTTCQDCRPLPTGNSCSILSHFVQRFPM